MAKRAVQLFTLAAVLLLITGGLAAQTKTTGVLVGTVVDPQGAAVSGAKVAVVDDATNASYDTATASEGTFSVGNLPASTYTVTITMQGFKKYVAKGVKVITGETYSLEVKLELGAPETTVVVEAGVEVMQTQTTPVSTTITGRAITNLPFTSRDALDLAVLMPGAQSPGRPRQTSFDGLPRGALNITMDGINVQDNLLKSNDGFFTLIRPRVDDVEEFSITTAANGVDKSGQGAIQISFKSKGGGNEFHGGVWEYVRNDWFNANYYFNNLSGTPRQIFRLNEFGGKVGGPIMKNKLFFFGDMDNYSNPQSVARFPTILTSAAASGLFSYAPVTSSGAACTPGTAGCVATGAINAWTTCFATWSFSSTGGCTTNLMQMVNTQSGGAISATPDTVISTMLGQVGAAATAPGVQLSTPPSFNQQALSFNNPIAQTRRFPDVRFDYNASKAHSFEFDYHYSHFTASPDNLNGFDPTFPVVPFVNNHGGQISNRNLFVGAWRYNMGSNKSNEVRVGIQSAPVSFFPDLNLGVYPSTSTNLGSIHIRPGVTGLMTNPWLGFSTQGRNGALGQVIDTFTWAKGAHTVSLGFDFTQIRYNGFFADESVAGVGLGLDGNDPAAPLFTTCSGACSAANLPGMGSADLTNAQSLWATLAGRVTSYSGSVYLNAATRAFQTGHNFQDKIHQKEFGTYVNDSWRLRPSLTLTLGIRWEYQGAPKDQLNEDFIIPGGFGAVFGVSGLNNLFRPGTLTGSVPSYQLAGNTSWYNKDLHDFAPSVGIAWTPGIENNLWKKLFGGAGKSVIRGGYSFAYTREGINNFISLAEGNPGYSGSQTAASSQQFSAGTVHLQSLSTDLTSVVQTPTSFVSAFPITPNTGQSINVIDPHLRTPRVQSWTLGIQRELSASTVMEIRYVGNHGTGLWRQDNLNEVNIFENGFLREFQAAQTNQSICIANSTACKAAQGAAGITSGNQTSSSFYNWGLSGQQPLPIITTALNGSLGPNYLQGPGNTNLCGKNTGSAAISSPIQCNSNWISSTFVNDLLNGTAGGFGNSLWGNLSFLCNLTGQGAWPSGTCSGATTNGAVQAVSGLTTFPKNFWVVNPDARGGAFRLFNGGQSTYNALQVEMRRRLSKGLTFNGNYTFSKSLTDIYADSSISFLSYDTLRQTSRNKGPSPFDIRHAFKIQGNYQLPFGPGQKWASSSGIANRILGGWEINAITRWQAGRVTRLTGGSGTLGFTFNQNDAGINLLGITRNQLQGLLGIRQTPTPAPGAVYWLPTSLLDANQQKANFSVLSPCTTPGIFCNRVFISGPHFFRSDLSLSKTTKITERVEFQIRAEFLNAFNNIDFLYGGSAATNATAGNIQSTSFGRMTSAYQDISTTDDPGGRIIQLVARINF